MKRWQQKILACAATFALPAVLWVPDASALDVQGLVVGTRSTIVSSPVLATTPAVFKIRVRVTTRSRVLRLCLGTGSQALSNACPLQVAESSMDASGTPRDGLGIVDTAQLNGKVLYLANATSGAPANDIVGFVLTIE